jgi:hypothetical protein
MRVFIGGHDRPAAAPGKDEFSHTVRPARSQFSASRKSAIRAVAILVKNALGSGFAKVPPRMIGSLARM